MTEASRTEEPVAEKATALGREFSVPIPYETHRDGSYMPRDVYGGLTKREVFAAMAMQGLCANPSGPFQANGMSGWGLCNCTVEDIALTSLSCADALLKELAK